MKRRDLSLPLPSRRTGKPVISTREQGRSKAFYPPELFRWTGFLLHRVEEVAQRLYHKRMIELRLRPHQVGILQLLSAEGPLVQARLGERLGVDKATIVPAVNGLEDQRLVRRKNHPDDGRAFIVHLTSAGRERLAAAEAANQRITADLFASLSLSEKEQLHVLLQRVADHLRTAAL